MHLKLWFSSKKLWFRGGIIGVLVCLVLGIVDLFIYFPIIDRMYDDAIPDWTLSPLIITGHAFPVMSHFIVPYGWLCKFSETICTHWSAGSAPGATAWTMDGVAGYCIEQTQTPTSSCANLSEMIGFFGITFFLFAAYFAIGAAIGLIVQKRKAKRQV